MLSVPARGVQAFDRPEMLEPPPLDMEYYRACLNDAIQRAVCYLDTTCFSKMHNKSKALP
jgi:hypothetical protein